jgi:MFS family permease
MAENGASDLNVTKELVISLPQRAAPAHTFRFWGISVALCLLSFISALDVAIINTALPTITAEIGGAKEYTWIANSFVLASSVFQPLFGQLANLFGRRKPLIVSSSTPGVQYDFQLIVNSGYSAFQLVSSSITRGLGDHILGCFLAREADPGVKEGHVCIYSA